MSASEVEIYDGDDEQPQASQDLTAKLGGARAPSELAKLHETRREMAITHMAFKRGKIKKDTYTSMMWGLQQLAKVQQLENAEPPLADPANVATTDIPRVRGWLARLERFRAEGSAALLAKDGPVVLPEIRPEPEGHGSPVAVREVPGDSGQT